MAISSFSKVSSQVRLLAHKVSAKRIQRILRHKNLSITERYIQNINDDLKSTLELLSQEKIPQHHTPNKKEANQMND